MANITAKTSSNVFYQARCNAATHNEQLSSREGAADYMSIDRGRLYRIESGIAVPYPEEIRLMAGLYNAPELENYFCSGKTARCLTGSGPVTWAHDHTNAGIMDMKGNVWEWQDGLRLNNGEINIVANNNAALGEDCDTSANSTLWKAKMAPTKEEREEYRQKYLEAVGMHRDFRW